MANAPIQEKPDGFEVAPVEKLSDEVLFNNKLFNLQQSIDPITKDTENPFFHSKYFDINKILEVLTPKLAEQRLFLLQPLKIIDGKNVLVTIIADADSNRIWESNLQLPDFAKPQEMGSAITYYRRYSLQSFLGLAAEDDDANATVSGYNPPPKPPAVPKPPVAPKTPPPATPAVPNTQTGTQPPQTPPKPPYKPTGNAIIRVCPSCAKEHGGPFPKCKECYFAEKAGTPVAKTKTIINEQEPPDFVH